MDSLLKQAIGIAVERGSRYLKGEATPDELHSKVAELGIFLLAESQKLQGIKGESLRTELNVIQNKIDDLRKTIFSLKGKILSTNA